MGKFCEEGKSSSSSSSSSSIQGLDPLTCSETIDQVINLSY
jgi:hypothetical protein